MSNRKVAVVTGAANGIGEAAARLFAQKGYAVCILDVVEKMHQVEAEITAAGGDCNVWQSDVSNETNVKAFIGEVVEKNGRIDVLNNNAGIVVVKPLEEIEWADFKRVVDVNIGGIFLFCKHVLPVMKKQKDGSVANMGSVSDHVGQIDHTIYGATR